VKRWHLTAGLTGLATLALFTTPSPGPSAAGLRGPGAHESAPPLLIPEVDLRWEDALAMDAVALHSGFDRGAVARGADDEVRYLTVAVTGLAANAAREPVQLAVVMDTSASMAVGGKMADARSAAVALAGAMTRDDRFSLTLVADDAIVAVPMGPVDHPERVGAALADIYPGGGSNLYAGLHRGMNELRAGSPASSDDGVRRLILLSDGRPNVGIVDEGALLDLAAELNADGASLSTVGIGLDYDHGLLQRLADRGGGTYTFVDDPRKLTAALGAELHSAGSVAVQDLRLDLLLAPGMRVARTLGWEAEPHPGGASVFVGDVARGQRRKVVFELEVDGREDLGPARVRATYRVAEAGETADKRVSWSRADLAVTDQRAAHSWTAPFAVDAARAQAGDLLERGFPAEAAALLRRNAAELSAPELAVDAADLPDTGRSPRTERSAKHDQERSRDLAR
jgi:Ca-activated chloride channel homolog